MKVKDIQALNFPRLTSEQTLRIKKEGRPTPPLQIVQISKVKDKSCKREFSEGSTYARYDWMCGCEEVNRVFCFPCLLFAEQKSDATWISVGVNNLQHMSDKAKKHATTFVHMNSVIDLNLLGKEDVDRQLDPNYRETIKQLNEQVSKNRYTLSKIIDCIRFCGAFELALKSRSALITHKGSDESEGVFKSLIDFSAELDVALKTHLERATGFKGTPGEIQSLLECMLNICQDQIRKEISEARFVSLICEEERDFSCRLQLVTVFRYILKDGQLVERFWGFSVPSGDDAKSVANSIEATLKKASGVSGDPDKLISQSHDGVNIMCKSNGGVETFIKSTHKNAHFVHCYDHDLSSILTQSLSQNQSVRVFFSNLGSISKFFTDSPMRTVIFDKLVGKGAVLQSPNFARWSVKSKAVKTVHDYREKLIEFMEQIECTSKQDTTIAQASGLCRTLNDSSFIFWLTLFQSLMPLVDNLFEQLIRMDLTASELEKCISDFEIAVAQEKDTMGDVKVSPEELRDLNAHEDLVGEKVFAEPFAEPPNKRPKKCSEETYFTKLVAAKEICDIIVNQVKRRFEFKAHLIAVKLLNVKKLKQYDKESPVQLIRELCQGFSFFDQARLSVELQVIYGKSNFQNKSGPASLLQFLIDNNLQSTLVESVRLLEYVVVTPMITTDPERRFTTLKKIKAFSRSTMREKNLSALAMLSIGKTFIDSIPDFNERVINLYASKPGNSQHFTYKKYSQKSV